jgi:hypothetical protein
MHECAIALEVMAAASKFDAVASLNKVEILTTDGLRAYQNERGDCEEILGTSFTGCEGSPSAILLHVLGKPLVLSLL